MRNVFGLLIAVTCLFVTKSYGLVNTIIVHSDIQDNATELWADDHDAGSKEENLLQLKQFVESVLTTTRAHLIIESKFFFGFDTSQSIDKWIELLGEKFCCGGQAPHLPTWIGWDLPLVLISIATDGDLPDFISIDSTQRMQIKNNITFEFIDPRLSVEANTESRDALLMTADQALYEFNAAKKSSPKKVSKTVANFAEEHCRLAKNGDPDSVDHLLDVHALRALIADPVSGSNNENAPQRRIVLCGSWHAKHLDKLIPHLSYTKREVFYLNTNPVATKPTPKTGSVKRRLSFSEGQ